MHNAHSDGHDRPRQDHPDHPDHPRRGYALIFVLVLGVVLASLSGILLYATGRDNAEARQQHGTVRALYAAEGAVSWGVAQVELLLDANPQPDLTGITAPALPSVDYPVFRVGYFDPATGVVANTPPVAPEFAQIPDGENRGLFAQQTPIQVLATAEVNNAKATVADAIRIDQIPIFQFAMFADGDFEMLIPAEMSVNGRVHANGNIYLSNGVENMTFRDVVSAAGYIHNRSAHTESRRVGTGSPGTFFSDGTNLVALQRDPLMPLTPDTTQANYLSSTFEGNLLDRSTGTERLEIPIRLSGRTPCTSTCTTGFTCVKKNPADQTGFCMENVTSRPDVCGDGSSTRTRDNFHQSLAYELIRRPLGGYSGYTRSSTTDFYTIDHGPHPADTGVGGAGVDDARDQEITSAVPVLGMSNASDDPGVQRERFYWKADLRIVDGIWTRKDGTVVFNPETWALGTAGAPLDLADPQVELGYKIARVLRYSWFWDPRESRVYGGSAATSRQRAIQIRATDFDVAAFNALLEDSDARSLLLPGGLPPQGIIVYVSETYDPVYEDHNTILSDHRRGANVRNYLNFAVMQNHLNETLIGDNGSLVVLSPAPPPAPFLPTPTDRGWWPERLWGRAAPLGFRSLTLPQHHDIPSDGAFLPTTTGTALSASVRDAIGTFYRDPLLMPFNAGTLRASPLGLEGCYEPSLVADARDVLPDTRPASFATPAQRPPCIQSGATPMGPENAVRVVRAQTVPAVGLTIASDNRMYIYGDVNVRENSTVNVLDPTGSNVNVMQDIPGKVSFIADSVTILSARFSDRFMQRGGHRDFVALGDLRFNRRARFSATKQAYEAPYSVDTNRPWSHEAEAEDGVNATDLGNAPNLCSFGSSLTAGTSTQTVGALPADFPTSFASALQSSVSPRHIRQALPTRINASIITGDVPACVDGGTNDGNPSGGMNNLPRFIESWGSFGGNITHNVIYGSLISLYRSERGNARYLDALFNPGTDPSGANWQAAPNNAPYAWSANPCVYAAPLRVWSFDTALTDPANLPPGTPKVVDTHRLRWVRR